MNKRKKLALTALVMICSQQSSYGFSLFGSSAKDRAYYKELLDSVEDRQALADYRFDLKNLYEMLSLCCGESSKLEDRGFRAMSLAAINELDRIIERIKETNENDPRLLDLLYLRTMAVNQKFDKIKRF